MARDSSATDGPPSTASRRTIVGILVHLGGLLTGFVVPGIVYLAANTSFTRSNALNALNWHLFALGAGFLATILAFGFGTLSETFVLVGAIVGVTVALLNIVFCIWAALKAIRGNTWEYPIAPTVIDPPELLERS